MTICINFVHLISYDMIVDSINFTTTKILFDPENNSLNPEPVDLCVKPEYPGETRRGGNPNRDLCVIIVFLI